MSERTERLIDAVAQEMRWHTMGADYCRRHPWETSDHEPWLSWAAIPISRVNVDADVSAALEKAAAAVGDAKDHRPTGVPESQMRWYLLGQQANRRRAVALVREQIPTSGGGAV